MMKNLNKMMRITLAAMILPLTSFSQIVDGGFENWDSVPFMMGGKNFMPNGWAEFNNEICQMSNSEWSVTRVNDAYKGNYAIQLKNILNSQPQNAMIMTSSGNTANMNNKIPVNGKPTRLDFYYKFLPATNDTFNVSVLLVNGEDIIGVGTAMKFTPKLSYTQLSVPIMYQIGTSIRPDSAVIVFTLGNSNGFVEGTRLIIDEVAFGYTTGIGESASSLNANVRIWPNPASDYVRVDISEASKQVTLELVNSIGETIQQKREETTGGELNTGFDLSGYGQGIYFIKISDHNGSRGFRVLHQ